MKNVIVLQKDKDGNIICQQITQRGIEYMLETEGEAFWEEGGTILLEEIDEILNKEIG